MSITATRLPDWPERLAEAIEARRHVPFAWGSNDCCLCAADIILAITGRDPAAPWRGRYSNEDEAAVLLREGLEAVVAGAMVLFGAEEIPPLTAGRGDLALIPLENETLLGVVLSGTIAAPGKDGLGFVRSSRALRAWRI